MAKFNSHVDMDGFDKLISQDNIAKKNNTTIGRFFFVAHDRRGYAFYQVVGEADEHNYQLEHVDIGTEILPALAEKNNVMSKEFVHHEIAFRQDSLLFMRLMQHKFSNDFKVNLMFAPGFSEDMSVKMRFQGAFCPI